MDVGPRVQPPGAGVRFGRLPLVITIAVVVALTAVITVVVARTGADDTAAKPPSHGNLTEREYDVALRIARSQIAKHDDLRRTRSATATVGSGTVLGSNLGHRCLSGTLLHIKLIGNFAIPTGGTGYDDDGGVHGVLITADPKSGHACSLAVETGRVRPDPGAAVLFRR